MAAPALSSVPRADGPPCADRPFCAGVVGVGAMGRHHVRLLADLLGRDSVMALDADRERAAGVAAEHGVGVAEDLEELGAAVDAAVVAVPTVDHLDVAGRLIADGCHVLVEKPIAASLETADALVEAAISRGVVLAVGHVEFYNPAVQRVLAQGLAPRFVEVERLSPFSPRSLDVDVVLDLMIHDLQILHALDPSPVREVRAVGIDVLSDRVDIADARIEFESGCVANLTASRVSADRVRQLRVFFEDRYLSLDYQQQTVRGARRVRGGSPGAEGTPLVRIVPSDLEVEAGEPLRGELVAFLDRCRGGGARFVDGKSGRRALQTALLVNETIARGAAA